MADAHAVPVPLGKPRRAAAISMAVVAYLTGYGLAAYVAISTFSTSTGSSDITGTHAWFVESALTLLTAFAGVVIANGATETLGKAAQREWWWGRRASRPGANALSVAVFFGSVVIGAVLVQLLHSAGGPALASGSQGPWTYVTLTALGAGVGEELVVVALPVVLVRFCWPGRRWSTGAAVGFVALLACLRLAYHLYYGPSTLTLVLWAVAVPIVYLKVGKVWPLILCHLAYDLWVNVTIPGWSPTAYYLPLAAITAAALAVWLTRRHSTARRTMEAGS